MHIIHFTNSAAFGGVETHVVGLCEALAGSGHKLTVICDTANQDRFKSSLARTGVEVHALPCRKPFSWSQIWGFITLLKKLQPDILHCHLYFSTRFAALPAKLAGVPLVLETIHMEEPWRKGINRLWLKLDGFLGRVCVDRYLAVSHSVAAFYRGCKGVAPEKLEVIHNAVPDGVRVNPSASAGFVLGFLGRMAHQKGIDVLLKALAMARCQGVKVPVRIGGDGDLLEPMRVMAHQLGVDDQIEWLGRVEDKTSFFSSIHAFVLPSRFEGFPLVLLEAGQHGMPVIATSVSGNPEIIRNEETGLLVPSEDPAALAAAILRMAEDAKLRETLAAQLAQRVRREFSYANYVVKMRGFYQRFLSRNAELMPGLEPA